MITDSHMHTGIFSPDAEQTPEELIKAAKSLNLKHLAITDHYDMDFPDKSMIWTFDLDKYGKTVPSWNEMSLSSGGPAIHMGIEIGWQAHLKDRIEAVASALPYDSVILAVHLYEGEDIYDSNKVNELSRRERNTAYMKLMTQMCRENDDFDIAAHYDYISRYVKDDDCFMYYNDCPSEFDAFFETIIAKNKALEINTGTILKLRSRGIKENMPDPEVIKRYLDMGGRLITVGSDAHSSGNVGVFFDETASYLMSLGVKSIYYYEGREPKEDPEYSKIL